jgi:peptidoglycan hydrolase-like protein with peptidoglycan-binding domain
VPSVSSESYFNSTYGAVSYASLSSGNNNIANEYTSNEYTYNDSIGNEYTYNDSGSNGYENSSNVYSDNVRSDSVNPSSFNSASVYSGSYKSATVYNGNYKPATVYNAALNPGKQVATVVEAVPEKPVTPCEPYLKTYLGCGFGGEKTEIVKLQKFLRDYEGYEIKITGVFDDATTETVKKFQEKYALDVLKESWGLKCTTGCVYITTKAKINDIVCKKSTNYKTIPLPNPRPKFVCPKDSELKSGAVKVTKEISENCLNGAPSKS